LGFNITEKTDSKLKSNKGTRPANSMC